MEVNVAERELALPTHLFHRFLSPAVLSTLVAMFATAVSLLLRRTRQPRLPRMSEAWLRNHDLNAARNDSWRGY